MQKRKSNAVRVWEELGLTYNQYFGQLQSGTLKKDDIEQLKNDMIKKRAEKIKAIKEKYPTIKSFNKKVNGCIKKVISDKKVSDHRLRGNFAKKLVEYDRINNISGSIVNAADELGHNINKNNRKNLEQYNDLIKEMLGYNLSDALDIYAKSDFLKLKQRIIKAFDEYSGTFKYLDIPSNKIPHIKSNKNNKKDKK